MSKKFLFKGSILVNGADGTGNSSSRSYGGGGSGGGVVIETRDLIGHGVVTSSGGRGSGSAGGGAGGRIKLHIGHKSVSSTFYRFTSVKQMFKIH